MNKSKLHTKGNNTKSINITIEGKDSYKVKVKRINKTEQYYKWLSIIVFVFALVYAGLSIYGIVNNWSNNNANKTLKIIKSILYIMIPISGGVTALFINRFKTSDKISILALVVALTSLITSTVQ